MFDGKQIANKLVGSDDERAVSPVIGVILMVAITVILAAVIAAFVMDIGDMGEQAPTATIEFDESLDGGSSESVTIMHSGGEALNADNVYLSIEGEQERITEIDFEEGDVDDGDEISAGETVMFESASTADLTTDPATYHEDGDTIQIIWESDDSSQILGSFETTE